MKQEQKFACKSLWLGNLQNEDRLFVIPKLEDVCTDGKGNM